MPTIPSFDENHLTAICQVLADTNEGLSGSEIGRLLAQCNIEDKNPTFTKWKRLFNALATRQNQDRCGNCVCSFIANSMAPIRFRGKTEQFEDIRSRLNVALAFSGLTLRSDGKFGRVAAASTLDEAEERVSRLRKKLTERKVHDDVLNFCRRELLQDNYFHAVFEATKSVADKIRDRTGLHGDGSSLVDAAFGAAQGLPHLAFNSLRSDTERSEHTGLMQLMKGLFSTFRNTTGHAPKIHWPIEEQDALDILSLCSLLHRRLDSAVPTGRH